MPYRKVYLTIEEEEDLQRLSAARREKGQPNAAFNAILKEGLGMVVDSELAEGGVLHTPRRRRGQSA
jgi:hypothetical protein